MLSKQIKKAKFAFDQSNKFEVLFIWIQQERLIPRLDTDNKENAMIYLHNTRQMKNYENIPQPAYLSLMKSFDYNCILIAIRMINPPLTLTDSYSHETRRRRY